VFLLREAKDSRVVNISKPDGIFSFAGFCSRTCALTCFLSPRSYRSRNSARDRSVTFKGIYCSEDGRLGFGRLDLLEFRKLISSVFDEVGRQTTIAQLSFEPVEVMLFGGPTCLGLPPPLKSIVSKKCGNKGDS